jgi:hypothetical protein
VNQNPIAAAEFGDMSERTIMPHEPDRRMDRNIANDELVKGMLDRRWAFPVRERPAMFPGIPSQNDATLRAFTAPAICSAFVKSGLPIRWARRSSFPPTRVPELGAALSKRHHRGGIKPKPHRKPGQLRFKSSIARSIASLKHRHRRPSPAYAPMSAGTWRMALLITRIC